jgi:hypothetical protein
METLLGQAKATYDLIVIDTPPLTAVSDAFPLLKKVDDESWEKLPFYVAHDVDEVLIVDPTERRVRWLGLAGGEYRDVRRSGLIELGADELSQQIDWPPIEHS